MPKVKPTPKAKPTRVDPISSKPKARNKPISKPPKDPKASHLYTDDNPSTTIHGTGFKDAAAAHMTLDLIKNRSLIYQWQTVNTMYNRAKHHPSMKKAAADENAASTSDMRAAMEIFNIWLTKTYPASKAALRGNGGFKPLLSKKVVERYLPLIEASEDVSPEALTFAKMYVGLPRGKKLGNLLVDEGRPAEADWEGKRYGVLCALVPEGREEEGSWEGRELWMTGDDGGRQVTGRHLELLAWAWSPVKEGKLPGT